MTVINELGTNSYAISCNMGTKVSEILDDILEIANTKVDGELKHGWKFIGSAKNYNLTYNLGTKLCDVIIFESLCLAHEGYNRKKYILFCADIEENTIEIMSTNGWDYTNNWLSDPVYSLSSIKKMYTTSYVLGRIEHKILIPNDRFEFIIFINKFWFAATIRCYSTISQTHFNTGDLLGYGTQVLGLSGVFESFNNFNQVYKSVLLNTALSLGNFYSYAAYYPSNLSAAAVDDSLLDGRSSIELGVLGNDIFSDNVYNPTVITRGTSISGMNDLKDNKIQVKMLELIRSENYDFIKNTPVNFVNLCKVYGLKITKFEDKMLATVDIPSNEGDYSLNNHKSSKKHFNVPAYVKMLSNTGVAHFDYNVAGFLMPA